MNKSFTVLTKQLATNFTIKNQVMVRSTFKVSFYFNDIKERSGRPHNTLNSIETHILKHDYHFADRQVFVTA